MRHKIAAIFIAVSAILTSACSPDGSVSVSDENKSSIGAARGWKTPHAGQMRSGPMMQAEGVPIPGSPGAFFIYFYNDKGEPIDMSGASGRAGFAANQEAKVCEFSYTGANSVGCSIKLADTPNLQVKAYVKLPNGQVAQINYDFLLASNPDTAEGVAEAQAILQATDSKLQDLKSSSGAGK